jgi:hypothetical protein
MEKFHYYYGRFSVRESNASVYEIFRTGPDRPGGPPGLVYNGYRFLFSKESDQGVVLTTPST